MDEVPVPPVRGMPKERASRQPSDSEAPSAENDTHGGVVHVEYNKRYMRKPRWNGQPRA